MSDHVSNELHMPPYALNKKRRTREKKKKRAEADPKTHNTWWPQVHPQQQRRARKKKKKKGGGLFRLQKRDGRSTEIRAEQATEESTRDSGLGTRVVAFGAV